MKSKYLWLLTFVALIAIGATVGTTYKGKFIGGGYSPDFIGNGAGLTNLPVAAQVWTNDGPSIHPVDFPDTLKIGSNGHISVGKNTVIESDMVFNAIASVSDSENGDLGFYLQSVDNFSSPAKVASHYVQNEVNGSPSSYEYSDVTTNNYTTYSFYERSLEPGQAWIKLGLKSGSLFAAEPTIEDGSTPYKLNTSIPHTSGYLLELTNKFTVGWDGAVTAGGATFTAGTRTFQNSSTSTAITNTATLTGTEFSAGQRKDWYNGAVTTTLDKTNGNLSLAGALQVNGNHTNNGYLAVTNTTSASPSGMTGLQLYGGSNGVNANVINSSTNGSTTFSVSQSGILAATGGASFGSASSLGSLASPLVKLGTASAGFYGYSSGLRFTMIADGQVNAFFGNATIDVANGCRIAFESGATGAGDTSISRLSGGILGIGTGPQSSLDGTLKAANFIATNIVNSTNGVASFATAASIAISATGWTNNYYVNAVVDFDAGAYDLQWYVKNSAGTGVYTNTAAVVRHAETILQPGGALVITSGTSPSGTARQF